MKDLGTIIQNLGTTFPLAAQLTLMLLALFGLCLTAMAINQAYQIANEGGRAQYNYGQTLAMALLGGACVVAPLIIWRFANTLALGGNQTAHWLSYSPVKNAELTKYCENSQFAITGLFMLFGTIAIFSGAYQLYSRAKNPHQGSSMKAVMFIVGGVLCIFSNDVALIIGNTFGARAGLGELCKVFSG